MGLTTNFLRFFLTAELGVLESQTLNQAADNQWFESKGTAKLQSPKASKGTGGTSPRATFEGKPPSCQLRWSLEFGASLELGAWCFNPVRSTENSEEPEAVGA